MKWYEALRNTGNLIFGVVWLVAPFAEHTWHCHPYSSLVLFLSGAGLVGIQLHTLHTKG